MTAMIASAEEPDILALDASHAKGLSKLIEVSHSDPIDLMTNIPWHLGVNRRLPPRILNHSWLYGTKYYDGLTGDQKLELSWLEIARDVAMFISLEQFLPILYVGFTQKYTGTISNDIAEYLLIFSREEISHTLMFKRYQKTAGLKDYRPMTGGLVDVLPTMHPIAGVLFTLLVEWIAELGAMYSTQSDEVDPLTRQLFYRHHVDEARHIAFGRWLVERHFATHPEEELVELRQMARNLLDVQIPGFTFNREVIPLTSFDFPFADDDEEAINAVLGSNANAALNNKRFGPLLTWLERAGVL